MNLDNYGLHKSNTFYQTPIDKLQEIIVNQKQGFIVDSGALAIYTGKFTGRSPKDRYIVKDNITKDKVWWGDINIPIARLLQSIQIVCCISKYFQETFCNFIIS
jgi:phosphoenolpyruvate carboxykinase (ATP)